MAPRTRSGGKRDQKPGTGKEFNTDRPKKKCRLQQIVCENTETKNSHTIDSMATAMNINDLPDDVMLEIFSLLTHNELCRISRVCRKWKEYTENPVLWIEVDVKLFLRNTDISEKLLTFAGKLPFTVTRLNLDFVECFSTGLLNFEEFCIKLSGKCPNLHTLVMYRASFSVDLSSVITLCNKFLLNLKVLILPLSYFKISEDEIEHYGISKIEILDVSCCWRVRISDMQCISEIPCLKKLSLHYTGDYGSRLQHAKYFSFLERLEYLNLGCMNIDSTTFHILRIHARSLTHLFLCYADLQDNDFIFDNAFPLLKSICIKRCYGITCEGIKSLLQSCQSLENVYVDEDLAEAWVKYTLNTTNNFGVVKYGEACINHDNLLNSLIK